MLDFEIRQRESGFYSKRTDRITQPSSTVLVYRYISFTYRNYFKHSEFFYEIIIFPRKYLFFHIPTVILFSNNFLKHNISDKLRK